MRQNLALNVLESAALWGDHPAEAVMPVQWHHAKPTTPELRLIYALVSDALLCLTKPIASREYRNAWRWFADVYVGAITWEEAARAMMLDHTAVTERVRRYFQRPPAKARKMYLRKPKQGEPFPVPVELPLPHCAVARETIARIKRGTRTRMVGAKTKVGGGIRRSRAKTAA